MESLPSNPIRRKADRPPPLPILPPELIYEIFSWLPVDSLLRFRCVCKSFKTLISSPNFVKSHLRSMKALSNTRPNCVERLFRRSTSVFMEWDRSINCRLVSHSLYPLFNDPQVDLPNLASLLDRYFPLCDWVVGSCNGLLCSVIHPYCELVLWNPSTRVTRSLPDYEPSSKKWTDICYTVLGFGYDFQLDDYKVVAVLADRDREGTYQTSVNVFALKTKAWRKIGAFEYGVPSNGDAKFAAGSLYYKMRSLGFLVSLDLATETYGKVMLPEFKEAVQYWELETLVDHLCITCYNADGSYDVCFMEGPGWTNLVKVDWIHGSLGSPLCSPYDGEVPWETYESSIIYNSKDKICRLPTSKVLKNQDRHSTVYMGTLVSPWP